MLTCFRTHPGTHLTVLASQVQLPAHQFVRPAVSVVRERGPSHATPARSGRPTPSPAQRAPFAERVQTGEWHDCQAQLTILTTPGNILARQRLQSDPAAPALAIALRGRRPQPQLGGPAEEHPRDGRQPGRAPAPCPAPMRLIGAAVLGHAIGEHLPPGAHGPPPGPWSLSAPSFVPGVSCASHAASPAATMRAMSARMRPDRAAAGLPRGQQQPTRAHSA